MLAPSPNSRSREERPPEGGPIRIMIVDDSLVARTVMTRLLATRPEFLIVASVANAEQALDVVRTEWIDVVLLDLEMPGIGGLDLLPKILAESEGAHVMIVSNTAEGQAATVQALALGAVDVLQKPEVADFLGRFADTLADRLTRIASSRKRGVSRPATLPPLAPQIDEEIECLAIGASTGGLHALTELLRGLPATFRAPILITQHLPPNFMRYFADQMAAVTQRPTHVAIDGERLMPGHVLVAPGEGHLRMIRTGNGVRVWIDKAPASSNCMPSVDPMFQSLAHVFGRRGVAVVLSGMGRDGTVGARAVADVSGEILVQDPETSVVWGMPGSITEAGLASAVLPPARIAERIMARARERSWN